uniref:Tho2 domain-containing protein n=1 Tax=Macrostomum lignano TaxID=282301 RepID=A0A1I8FP57_9PLAT
TSAILPALSLSRSYCSSGASWSGSLVRHLPFDLRYRLYGQCEAAEAPGMTPGHDPRRAEVTGRAKDGSWASSATRTLAHYSKVVIEQITRYDNLVTPVVDSFRYLNSLGLDVLAYCIIEALADSSEDSPRLLTLSTFVGAMCKKYTFDLAGCFQYALNQLKNKRCADLLLVRNTKKSSSRLKELLMEHGLVLPFAIPAGLSSATALCSTANQRASRETVRPALMRLLPVRSGFAHTINQLCDRKLRLERGKLRLLLLLHRLNRLTVAATKAPAQDAQICGTALEITSFVDASVEVTARFPRKFAASILKNLGRSEHRILCHILDAAMLRFGGPRGPADRGRARCWPPTCPEFEPASPKTKTCGFTRSDQPRLTRFCVFPRIPVHSPGRGCTRPSSSTFCTPPRPPIFSTLICFDRISTTSTLPLACLTENEARRYGRFLKTMLDTIMKWHSSVDVYKRECEGYPGFSTVFRKGVDGAPSSKGPDQLSYENYRHVVHKWHYRITKAFIACLEHGNYALIRNALLVLIRILAYYPRIQQFGSAVERRVEKLRQAEREKRKDLEAMAISYLGMLKKRKTEWVPEEAFHKKEKVEKSDATNGGPHAAAAVTASIRRAGSTANPGKAPGASPSRAAEQQQQQQQQQPDAKRRRTEHQHQRSAAAPAASAAPTSSETTSGSKRTSGSGEAASGSATIVLRSPSGSGETEAKRHRRDRERRDEESAAARRQRRSVEQSAKKIVQSAISFEVVRVEEMKAI